MSSTSSKFSVCNGPSVLQSRLALASLIHRRRSPEKVAKQDRIENAYMELWEHGEDFAVTSYGVQCLHPALQFDKDISVIVRDEYAAIWNYLVAAMQRLESAPPAEGAERELIVTGHPGIGKSLFLRYALGRALKEHIPVAFCDNDPHYVLCDETGCAWLDVRAANVLPRDVWIVLVDSQDKLTPAPQLFTQLEQKGYLVHVTSPVLLSRWRDMESTWRRCELVPVPCRSRPEMRYQGLYEKTSEDYAWRTTASNYTPMELFELLGPSPSHCFLEIFDRPHADVPENRMASFFFTHGYYLEDLFHNVPATSFCRMLGDDEVPPDGRRDFHRFFFATKYDVLSNPQDEVAFYYDIPTPFLRRLFHNIYFRGIK